MYFYEHENGTVQKKPDRVVDMGGGPSEYFDSPFVKKWWWKEGPNPFADTSDAEREWNLSDEGVD